MVGSSKILTVSYGTFSCTLEGFEDSFSTMKAIAEYFRDLAADDRYFGAEPATPDADMLARIAEREIARRVEARTTGTGIVLRTGSALPESQTSGKTAESVSESDAPPAPAATGLDAAASDDLTDQPETAAPTSVTSRAPAAAAEDAAGDDDESDAVAEPKVQVGGAEDATGSPSMEEAPVAAPDVQPVMPPAMPAPANARPADEVAPMRPVPTRVVPSTPVATPRVTERPTVPAHPDAESVAAKLQRIRAVVSRAAPQAPAAPPAAATLAPFVAPQSDAEAQDESSNDAEAVDDQSTAPAPATDTVPATPPSRIEARVIKMRRADFEAAVSGGTLVEEVGEEEQDLGRDEVDDKAVSGPEPDEIDDDLAADATDADSDTSLSAEDEAALQAELAALEAESGAFDEDADETPASDGPADDATTVTADAEKEDAERDMSTGQVTAEHDSGDDDSDEDDDSVDAVSNEADLADRDDDIAQDNDRVAAVTRAIEATTLPGPATLEPSRPGLADNIRSALAASLVGSDARDTTDDSDNLFAGTDTDDEDQSDADSGVDDTDDPDVMADFEDQDDDAVDASDEEGFDAEALTDDEPSSSALADEADSDDTLDSAHTNDDRTVAEDPLSYDDDAGAEKASDGNTDDVAEAPTVLRPRRVILSADPEDDDVDLDRIADQTDAAMDAPENRSRRDAIHQLKAAVAATEAARKLGEEPVDLPQTDRNETAFRDDLEQVVRPRRPVRPQDPDARSERPRPAPLKLVASQRVDAPAQAPRPEGTTITPVRPRRVALTEAPAPVATGTVSFAEFVADMGATDLTDRMEAAAAYTAFVEGHEDFSRPQLMSKLQETGAAPLSREDGLRAFGALLRQGRLTKVRNGRFSVSGDTRFHPERRAG